ncbi:MAG: hypothetical protein HOY79_33715 [Streptomyces sp.]|nr:hypothetical protein [Streptomyces sp.]NUS11349.1 hypothetical protein [Streptomyces sp.]NUS23375.1 hypothetical protein [Streptomyces sp.]
MSKPPVPARTFDAWPRIDVDTDRGSPHHRVECLAISAATHWALGPDGPYKRPGQSLAEIIRGAVHEGLLHLAELGLIDVDTARLTAASGYPIDRDGLRPAPTDPVKDSTRD